MVYVKEWFQSLACTQKKKVSPVGRNTPMEARTVPASQSLITDPCKESASEGITSNSNLRDPFHTKE